MKFRYKLTIGDLMPDDNDFYVRGIVVGDTLLECRRHIFLSYGDRIKDNYVDLQIEEMP